MTTNQVARLRDIEEAADRKTKMAEDKRHNRHAEVANYINAAGNLLKGGTGLSGLIGKAIGAAAQDPSWYMGVDAKSESITAESTTWGLGLGYPIEYEYVDGEKATMDMPGVMALEYVPTCGNSTSKAAGKRAPVNEAFNKMFTTIRNTAAGKNYEYADLAVYTLGALEIYSALAYARRVLQLKGCFDVQNAYYGEGILYALHIDAKDLRAHGGDYISRYNDLVNKMVWAIPSSMPIIKRRVWLNSIILKDDVGAKTQYYVYVPSVFYRYDDVQGKLQAMQWYKDLGTEQGPAGARYWIVKFSAFLDMIEDMLIKFATSSDASIINADIQRVFGESETSLMPYYPKDGENPLISTEWNALQQLHNAIPVGFALTGGGSAGILQNKDPASPGYGVFYDDLQLIPREEGTESPALSRPFLRWESAETPNSGDMYEITRFIPEVYYSKRADGKKYLEFNSYGTEIALSTWIFTYQFKSGIEGDWEISSYYGNSPLKGVSSLGSAMQYLHDYSVFDYAPAVIIYNNIANDPQKGAVYPPIWTNTDNFAILEPATLHNLHARAVRSEYLPAETKKENR